MNRSRMIAVILSIGVFAGGVNLVGVPTAQAATASNFDAGFIVSDEIFFNAALANEAQIDAVIQAQGASCTSTSGNPGCLKGYRTNTYTRVADRYCSEYIGAPAERAATVLMRVGIACGINPQALLVMLQKESGLVTRNNPSETAYRIAMGYGCPDTAACDTRYYGFFNQVFSAARQFKVYANSTSFNYKAGRNNTIQWHPNAACGSSVVFIQNKATAGLYNYTPYRPNQAALNNLYGTGDVCSSYGNRNFWRIFSDWFGSPTVAPLARSFVMASFQDFLGRDAGESGVAVWGRAITEGMPTTTAAHNLAQTDEYRLRQLDAAYRAVLGREPDEAGRNLWFGALRAGTVDSDDLGRQFRLTDEYFVNIGGSTNEGMVAALYEGVLKRPAKPEEVAGWSQVLATSGRQFVVDQIWRSPEAAEARVTAMYSLFLDRLPEDAARISWGGSVRERGDGWVRDQIVGSVEYWARSSLRYP